MTKIIRSRSPHRARDAYLQQIRFALQPPARGAMSADTERDRQALILDLLGQVEASTEQTALAWERRGYWTKADSFRHTWSWVGTTRAALLQSLSAKSPSSADGILADLLVRLIQLGVRPRPG